jgi:hypothetical protein
LTALETVAPELAESGYLEVVREIGLNQKTIWESSPSYRQVRCQARAFLALAQRFVEFFSLRGEEPALIDRLARRQLLHSAYQGLLSGNRQSLPMFLEAAWHWRDVATDKALYRYPVFWVLGRGVAGLIRRLRDRLWSFVGVRASSAGGRVRHNGRIQ